jgi:O-antigen ligase
MKSVAQLSRWEETKRVPFSPLLFCLILALIAALFLGAVLGASNLVYSIAVAGALMMLLIMLFRWDELTVMLIIAVHILVDWYLALRLVSVLMGLVFLFVCYFGRSADHPWVKPRPFWLWGLFLTLAIYPAINGGSRNLYDADTFYPSLILSVFMMFWLGNIIAKDVSAVRRVFQLLTVFAMFIAIHTIIEATTGKFLFESARAEALIAQNSGYQLVQNSFQTVGASVSRAGSFSGNPNGNGTFLAFSFFLPLGLFIESKQLWAKMIYLLEMLLILLALMFTFSIGSWIAEFARILAFLFLLGHKRYSVFLLMLIVTLTVIVFTVFPSQLAIQLSHASAQNEFSLHLASWETAIRVIEAFPLFGVGLGGQAYMVGSNPYRVPAQIVPLFEPDNSYLQWGAMAGIPVMLVFLLLLGYAFWFSWRNWRTTGTLYRPLLGGGIVALITLSISSLGIDGWTGPAGTVSLGWLIAGLVASPLIGHGLRKQPVPPVDKTEETIPAQTEVSQMYRAKQGS